MNRFGNPDTYGIFTMDREFADIKIDDFVAMNNKSKIVKRVKSGFESYAVMSDGTVYRWIRPIRMNRGYKCSIAIIDIGTCDEESIQILVLPCCLIAYQKDILIEDSRKPKTGESYDLITLIDRLTKIAIIKGNVQKLGYTDIESGWRPIDEIEFDSNDNELIYYCSYDWRINNYEKQKNKQDKRCPT